MPLDPKVELPKKHELSSIFDVVDKAPFVDPLDLRISLSQPRENDANAGDKAQAQAHLLINQAHLKSKKVVYDLTQYKSFGCVHFSSMDLSNGPILRRLEVVKVPDDSESFLQRWKLARQRACATLGH